MQWVRCVWVTKLANGLNVDETFPLLVLLLLFSDTPTVDVGLVLLLLTVLLLTVLPTMPPFVVDADSVVVLGGDPLFEPGDPEWGDVPSKEDWSASADVITSRERFGTRP